MKFKAAMKDPIGTLGDAAGRGMQKVGDQFGIGLAQSMGDKMVGAYGSFDDEERKKRELGLTRRGKLRK